ncbi:hypothetical protein O6H91_04G027600 [Diphasiastrum complanatum]|uniref:Uncharacterized protein n=1 Tax=Diphasiastrum complanatum TaxID=34168 RepID=A0ACC2DVB4_DIPCM|nr:hypothetical protein O6H91_04G027600 [Diphasiastrum complanatum]
MQQVAFLWMTDTHSSTYLVGFSGVEIGPLFCNNFITQLKVTNTNINCLKLPPELDDEHTVFLSDILPTAWHANELAHVGSGDNVAIWGSGPVGILAARCAFFRGAARVVIIDEVQYRLDHAKEKVKGVEIINRSQEDPLKEVRALFPHGPDVGIEAVGFHYVKIFLGVRKGDRIGVVGVYVGYVNHFNIGAFMEKELSMGAGQTPVQKYWPTLFPLVRSGKLDPTIVITHVLPLADAPRAYKIFNEKTDNCVKVVLKPQMDPGVLSCEGPGIKEHVRSTVSGVATAAVGSLQAITRGMGKMLHQSDS